MAGTKTSWKPVIQPSDIPLMYGAYPDAHMIDHIGDAPTYALWARNVQNLTLIDYEVIYTSIFPAHSPFGASGPHFFRPYLNDIDSAFPCNNAVPFHPVDIHIFKISRETFYIYVLISHFSKLSCYNIPADWEIMLLKYFFLKNMIVLFKSI